VNTLQPCQNIHRVREFSSNQRRISSRRRSSEFFIVRICIRHRLGSWAFQRSVIPFVRVLSCWSAGIWKRDHFFEMENHLAMGYYGKQDGEPTERLFARFATTEYPAMHFEGTDGGVFERGSNETCEKRSIPRVHGGETLYGINHRGIEWVFCYDTPLFGPGACCLGGKWDNTGASSIAGQRPLLLRCLALLIHFEGRHGRHGDLCKLCTACMGHP